MGSDEVVPAEVLERYLSGELGWKGEALPPEQMASALRALAGRLDPAQRGEAPPNPTVSPISPGILIQCASETHVTLLDASEAHHRRYAERWGLDMVCRRGAQQSERPPYWDRLHLLLLALRQGRHELVAVLDADCLIRAVEWDLRGALPKDAYLGMAAFPPGEGRYPKSSAPYLHSGVMLVRRGEKALAFFEEVWKGGEGVEDDNTAILRLLQREPEKWREGIAVLPETLNAPFGSPAAREGAIVAWHGMGAPEDRAASMAAFLGGGSGAMSGRELSPIWSPASPLPEGAEGVVSFKKLLGRPLATSGELPAPLLERVGRAALDVRAAARGKNGKSADVRFLSGEEGEGSPLLPELGTRILAYPWKGFLTTGLTPAFGLAEEIWAASRFERDTYVHLGIPAEKVQVVLPGVDTAVFAPAGPKSTLPTSRRRRLLLAGPLSPDAGADIALAAYREAFTREGDVCLVVLPLGNVNPLQQLFLQAESDGGCPEVLLLADELDEAGRASLYRSCHALLAPARRLPGLTIPLEAMACGLPVLVGVGSAVDDVAEDTSCFRVPVRWVREGGAYYQEADRRTLVEAIQSAILQPELTGKFGEVARARVEATATTSAWSGRMRARLARLVEPPLAEAKPATPWGVREPQTASLESPMLPLAPKPSRSRKKKVEAPKITLSLCMIARDEEERIGACLDSIKPFVDEMIVVDTGSKDRTREIALERGARVFEFPWVDSFAEARNQSLAQARGEWIFWMDADDIIPEECGKRLQELVALHPERDAAYQVQVRIPPGEGEYAETVVDHVKLFPNSPDVRFEFRIHEQVLPSLRRKGLDVLPSDAFVIHQHYDRSAAGQKKKRLRDFGLLERDLRERPEHPFVLFNLGMTHLFATKEFEAAAQYLERCLMHSHPMDSIVCKAYALLTTCRVCQRRWREARAACEAGLAHYPDDPELLYRAGQIYHELGELERSRLSLERLVGGGDSPDGASSVRNGVTGFSSFLGMFELAQVNLSLGETGRAESLLRRTLRDYPEYRPASELLHRLTGEAAGPERQEWPERPRLAVYYHAFLHGDWEPLVKEQLDRLVASGLHSRADRLVAGVIGSEAGVKPFLELLPPGGGEGGSVAWEVVGSGEDDAKGEYKTLRRLHEDGLSGQYEAAWYFHTKGITKNAPGPTAWRKYMEYFLLDRWEEGLRALGEGWDSYGVEWKSPTPDGPWHHYSGNFWAARADYLRCLSPMAFLNRFSCEDWIGWGNPRARCLHRSGVNLYEMAYSEDVYQE